VATALLINPSYFRTYGSGDGGIMFPVFPILGLMALSGAARDRGHRVEVLDLSYRRYDPSLIEAALRELQPQIVGVTATTPLMNQARDISFLVKDLFPNTVVVAGGAHPSALPAETLAESAFDLVATGEADHVVADLLDGNLPGELAGCWSRSAPGPTWLPQVPLLDDLDLLPMPAWESYPLGGMKHVTKVIARQTPVTTMEWSRGCIYRCDFCGSKNTMGRGYRKKSPERCAEELARVGSLGYREVVLTDDIFTSDNEWAAAVCEEIIRTEPGVIWNASNGIRVDSANTELFRLMKAAGCYRVFFGLESGNEDVLHAFGKGGKASLEKGRQAIDMAREAGLDPDGFFMVGLSGDTEQSMQDTIDYAKSVRLNTMKCGICVPYPGTPMFQSLHAAGRIKTLDWDAYTVYNQAENIFDHPTLSWDTITRYFRRFYRQAMTTNPGFVWRRIRTGLRNGDFFWSAYYGVRFWRTVASRRGKGTEDRTEPYAYEDRWRPLDTPLDQPLSEVKPPRAPGAKVTISGR
jgi:radical SAM superfamily enzyme YgiQ (UPF0313 family)